MIFKEKIKMINLENKLIIKRFYTCVCLCVKYLKVSFLY